MLKPMFTRLALAIALVLSLSVSLTAQGKSIKIPTSAENAVVAAETREGRSGAGKMIDPKEFLQSGERWNIRLTQLLSVENAGQTNQSATTPELLEQKRQFTPVDGPEVELAEESQIVQLQVQDNFVGNTHSGSTPPDNSIAVSDIGKLVSVTNSTLRFMDSDGTVNLQTSFGDYLSFLGLNGFYFDPKVIFDPVTKKYIMVVISGSSPPNNLAIGFSTTNDPMDPWFFYAFDGAPDGANAWFDYPNMAISEQDFYLSGNLFSNQSGFQQVSIYQMRKEQGHAGEEIDFVFYSEVTDADGFEDFNVVPVSYGYDGATTPGVFMASTNSFGGNDAQVYFTTDSVGGNPELMVYDVSLPGYFPTSNALMLNSNKVLRTNDTRLLSGYWANDILHFVMNSSGNSTPWTRIYYGKINTGNQTGTAGTYGLDGFDYAYPTIQPIGDNPSFAENVIGFCRSGESIYPEYRVLSVDQNNVWNVSQLIKEGDNSVAFLNDNVERWGDYTGITRQFSAPEPTIYLAGNYGSPSQVMDTWIGRVGIAEPAAPEVDFMAEFTQVFEGDEVRFFDQTLNLPDSWSWSFPGGVPSTSTQQYPEVTYNTEGVYEVSLTATNELGQGTETKTGYITVIAPGIAPTADFEASATTIMVGESIDYTDASLGDPDTWDWDFQGGSPDESAEPSPTVTYNEAGTYRVILQVANFFGQDSEVRLNYIEVLGEGSAPEAAFTADALEIEEGQNVNFTDQSTNEPEAWAWTFDGGLPLTSDDQNPTVLYNDQGIYDVSLTASNEFGENTFSQEAYISVGVTSVIESDVLGSFSLSPNPVTAGGELRATFTLEERTELEFYVVNAAGQVVRQLARHSIKAGVNELSFSTRYLPSGSYYFVVQGNGDLHSEPFVVR
ncbi:hypothetical protein CEQ90_13760 [Lewinellaceae bacterium SD302]|nr:hypothetical protein CEQ90_13760 [Lewinellaceae bacterium SD302]